MSSLNNTGSYQTNNSNATVSHVGLPNMRNTKDVIECLLRVLKEVGIEEITGNQWLAIRERAGKQIDPETAEVMWLYDTELSTSCGKSGRPTRMIYVRSPESNEWISFFDIPTGEIREALMNKHPWIVTVIGAWR